MEILEIRPLGKKCLMWIEILKYPYKKDSPQLWVILKSLNCSKDIEEHVK